MLTEVAVNQTSEEELCSSQGICQVSPSRHWTSRTCSVASLQLQHTARLPYFTRFPHVLTKKKFYNSHLYFI